MSLRFGLAVDVGTTTLVLELVDLETGKLAAHTAAANPQARMGADIMTRIALSHRAGDPPWSIERLSRALSLPGIAVADMAAHLEKSGLIAQADDGKVFPGREISNITLTDIVLCARRRHGGTSPPQHLSAPGVLELQQQMERAWRDVCGTRTLSDLISGR